MKAIGMRYEEKVKRIRIGLRVDLVFMECLRLFDEFRQFRVRGID